MRLFILGKKVLCLLLAGLFLTGSMGMAVASDMPSGKITISGSSKSVKFKHEKHIRKGSTCIDCHHEVNGEAKNIKCSTAGCHDNLTSKSEKLSLYKVMHGKTAKYQTCISCHAKVVEGKPDHKQKLLGCRDSKCHNQDK